MKPPPTKFVLIVTLLMASLGWAWVQTDAHWIYLPVAVKGSVGEATSAVTDIPALDTPTATINPPFTPATSTPSATHSPTLPSTASATDTDTPIATASASATSVPSATPSFTSAATPSFTLTATDTDIPSPTPSSARTSTATVTLSPTPTRTPTSAGTPGPSQLGQWAGPYAWPLVAIHGILLRTGEVLVLDDAYLAGSAVAAYTWNPSTNVFTPVPRGDNVFCSGHVVLADGRVLVIGGEVVAFEGLRDAVFFDPLTRAWSAAGSMAYKRWYPTGTLLADGRVLATTGTQNREGEYADIPELYNPANNAWSQLPGARLPLALYPFMFLLGDGRVLQAGSDEASTTTRVLNVASQSWSTVDSRILPGGSAALYAPGQVIKSGSPAYVGLNNDPVVANTYVIDMNGASPSWREVPPMAFARAHHNLTLLPDGSVLVTGGQAGTDGITLSQAVYEAEVWSAQTETWTTLAHMQTPRSYHSFALLLPDARVLVAGGGRWGPNQFSAEIYSPPYLFRGPRPLIQSAPATISYGAEFVVDTPNAGSIASVALVSPGAVTHSFDHEQRFVPLAFATTPTGLRVTAPAHPNLAPPGYYMLFIVDTNGTPSVARFVQLALITP